MVAHDSNLSHIVIPVGWCTVKSLLLLLFIYTLLNTTSSYRLRLIRDLFIFSFRSQLRNKNSSFLSNIRLTMQWIDMVIKFTVKNYKSYRLQDSVFIFYKRRYEIKIKKNIKRKNMFFFLFTFTHSGTS